MPRPGPTPEPRKRPTDESSEPGGPSASPGPEHCPLESPPPPPPPPMATQHQGGDSVLGRPPRAVWPPSRPEGGAASESAGFAKSGRRPPGPRPGPVPAKEDSVEEEIHQVVGRGVRGCRLTFRVGNSDRRRSGAAGGLDLLPVGHRVVLVRRRLLPRRCEGVSE